jgi:hypothetical protein
MFKKNIAIALGLVGAVVFSASTSFAAATPDVSKCQSALVGVAAAFQGSVTTAVKNCANKVAAENAKGAAGKATDMSVVADYCEKQLAGVYDLLGAKVGKSAVDKLRVAISDPAKGLIAKAKCDLQSLVTNSLMLSGADVSFPGSAPPVAGSPTKFLEDFLLVKGEAEAIKSLQPSIPGLMSLILQAQKALPGKKAAPDCSGAKADKNLCAFSVECKARGCKLAGSTGAKLWSGILGGPIDLVLAGTNSLEMCVMTGALGARGDLEPGIMYLGGDPGRMLAPVELSPGVLFVCVDTLRGSGWCDCKPGGSGIKLNTNICQDRIANNNIPPGASDSCGSLVSAASNDLNYPGNKTGLPKNTPGGSSTEGDCLDMLTTQFTIELNSFGADNHPCTADDTTVPEAPSAIPLTTGTAQATLNEAIDGGAGGYGTCSDGATPCLLDAMCADNVCTASLCSVDGTACTLPDSCDKTCHGVITETLTSGSIAGGKGAPGGGLTICEGYAQGNIKGLKLSGAFPGPGSRSSGLGDSVTAFTMQCE